MVNFCASVHIITIKIFTFYNYRPSINGITVTDTVPQGASDIGRRVAKYDASNGSSGWALIGVVVAYFPLQDRRLDGMKVGLGEDMAALFTAGEYERWKILYGDGTVEYCDAISLIKVNHHFS